MAIPYPERRTLQQMPSDMYASHMVTINSNYLDDIPAALGQWGSSRAVIIASRSLDQNTSIVQDLELALGNRCVGKKVGVGAHTPYADVIEIARLAHDTNADCFITLGSSSYSDATKIARLLHATLPAGQLSGEEALESLIDSGKGWSRRGEFHTPTTRLILVPCSLSVSEYNPVSSASHSNGKKQHFGEFSKDGLADLVLLDPRVASTAPPEALWLPSGARAIDHAIEGLLCWATKPGARDIELSGLKSLVKGLTAYKHALDEGKARDDDASLRGISECQQGARDAITGMLAYGSHFGPSHALGHQLGGVGKVSHGLTTCICLPAVLRYEKEHADVKYWNVQDHQTIVDVFNKEMSWNETNAGDAVERFFKSLGLPTRLSDVGVTEDSMVKKMAEKTLTDIWGYGPVQIDSFEDLYQILQTVR